MKVESRLKEIVKCLYENGMRPIVIGSPRIFLVEVPELDIRFINLENYVDTSFVNLQNTFWNPKAKNSFFPLRWLKETKFSYVGVPPNLKDMWQFEDTKEMVAAKKSALAKMTGSWNFTENLIEYSRGKCEIVAKASLHFLEQSFSCQSKLHACFPNAAERVNFVHPFNKPLFTKASYAYKLMCLFSKMEDVRIVKPAVAIQSSKGELEFCMYKKFVHKPCEVQTAWSPRGQKRFRESFPDYYVPAKKLCGYWNGCLVHGHPKERCTFKKHKRTSKNMFKIDLKTAYASYEEKKQKLIQNHPDDIQEIDEMWHCEWVQKKKSDEDVKYFMEHIYKNPPLYRLEARAAGELL